MRDLINRKDIALNEVTASLTLTNLYLEQFFTTLRHELGFYVGCLTLEEKLQKYALPVCIPTLLPCSARERVWNGLRDVSLALVIEKAPVGTELSAKGKILYVITGANQGGKSTFLRSVGQAQLMSHCGMPVCADSYTSPIRRNVFTHFKREEDEYMRSGKLDEELERMGRAMEFVEPGSMMMMNESFASTNEREGSEICNQITRALIENDVEVFTVSHLHTFATSYLGKDYAQYLCAEHLNSGERTFKIVMGEPTETAYGEELYHKLMD
jgi:hypothetical protein